MYKLICVVIVFVNTCNTCSSQQNINERLFEQILKHESMVQLLSLIPLEDYAPIRVVDKTNKLDLHFYLAVDSTGINIGVKSFDEVPIDFNTGYFRDIYVGQFEKKRNIYKITIYASSYYCYGMRKQRNSLYYTLQLTDNGVKVIKFESGEW